MALAICRKGVFVAANWRIDPLYENRGRLEDQDSARRDWRQLPSLGVASNKDASSICGTRSGSARCNLGDGNTRVFFSHSGSPAAGAKRGASPISLLRLMGSRGAAWCRSIPAPQPRAFIEQASSRILGRIPAPMPGSSEANQSAWNSVFCRLLDLDEKYRKAHWDGYGRAASGNMFGLGTNRDTGLH